MSELAKKVIKNDSFSLKHKLKSLAKYFYRKKAAKKSWENRFSKVFKVNPDYIHPCSKTTEVSHIKYWEPFSKRINLSTIRVCMNISGHEDSRIIPEEIFVSDIEPTLVSDNSVTYLSNKSFYNRWFPKGLFPKCFFHCINGQLLDADLEAVENSKIEQIIGSIDYPIILKANRDSYGGKDVHLIEDNDKLVYHMESYNDFVVQELINQHDFFAQFNPVGLNTFRVYVYRSVKDNSLNILSISLRMGRGGGLDNETAGGIHVLIKEDGFMNGYAVDKYGTKYFKHPDTDLKFDVKIPDLDGLKTFAIKIAGQVFLTNIIGLDICMDENGNWRAIEVNTTGHTIRFAQYGGKPFFGKFTEEVIEYCRNNHWLITKVS